MRSQLEGSQLKHTSSTEQVVVNPHMTVDCPPMFAHTCPAHLPCRLNLASYLTTYMEVGQAEIHPAYAGPDTGVGAAAIGTCSESHYWVPL
jgi:hypothetical protein